MTGADTVQSIIMWSLLVIIVQPLQNEDKSIDLIGVKIMSDFALFSWTGLDVSDVSECTYMYGSIGSTEKTVVETLPISRNRTLELTQLEPRTAYDLYLRCTSYGITYDTKTNFTTVSEGEVLLPQSSNMSSVTSAGSTTHPPPVQKEKIEERLNPVDIAIGVVFGAIGLGIVCTVLYYVTKKVRRQQRIRRFLQYRQQENDPFPGLEQRDDDGLYI